MIHITDEISEKLRKVNLEMLKEIDRICRNNNIKYSLCSGTLIGAVRHGGFIPWDNDADVNMLREEYEKFFEACKLDLDTKKFFLQDFRTDPNYRWGFPKLRYNNSVWLMPGQEKTNWHKGIFVDIFVYDGVPDNYFLRRIHLFICYCIRKGLYSFFGRYNAKNPLIRLWYKMLYLLPRSFWVDCFNFMVKVSNLNRHELARHLTFPYPLESSKYGMPRKCFDAYVDKDFEGYTFKIFKDYDSFLTSMYGDYMTLPPEEKRVGFPLAELKFPDDMDNNEG